MPGSILITPKSYRTYGDLAYPLMRDKGYAILENTLGRTMTEDEIAEYADADVVGIIIGIDPLPGRVLERFMSLKAISKYGMGLDNIDLKKAAEMGIQVDKAVGTNNVSVAELTIGLLFSAARSIPTVAMDVKQGGWGRVMGCEIAGKKLGLIGCGLIGREVLKRAVGLGMTVLLYDPYLPEHNDVAGKAVRCSTLYEVLREADFVSLHVPVTAETTKMMNEDAFRLMKPSSILINTSRGELVDEGALYDALVHKTISGAAQDVFTKEPPSVNEKLLALGNFILTAHIGAFTREAVERMVLVSTMNLLRMLEEGAAR